MTNSFTVFFTVISPITKRQSVSERGTLFSSTVLVTFVSSSIPCCIQLFHMPPEILTLLCIFTSSVTSLC